MHGITPIGTYKTATKTGPAGASAAIRATLLAFTLIAQYGESAAADRWTTAVIPTGEDPDAVAAADVNHDGKPDIIIANPNSGTVTVMLGDGTGRFHAAAGSPFAAGHLPSDIGAGDFDGDGNLDLIIPNHQTPYVTLLLGDGKGGFRAAPGSPFATKSRPHPHGVAVGHFCGASKPLDAVIDSWGSSEIELLLGDGKGNLTNGAAFPAGPGSDMPLRSDDLNEDGQLDIVMPDTAIGHWDSNKVSVLLGDGQCGFHAAPGSPFPAGAVPWSVAVGDMNNDRNPDVVLIPYGPKARDPREIAATVLLGDGKGGFHPMPGSPFNLPGCASPRRVAVGDVNGDGFQDFAVTCSQSHAILVFLGTNKGTYQVTPVTVPDGAGGKEVAERGILFAALTGTGRDSIIVTNGSAGTITLLSSR